MLPSVLVVSITLATLNDILLPSIISYTPPLVAISTSTACDFPESFCTNIEPNPPLITLYDDSTL